MKATKLRKLFFWFILGCFSIFFAEIIAGSTAFPFTTLVGWLIVYPVYALHILFFSSIIYRYGKPSLYTLFIGGALFGMYEAYLTRVIWNSYIPEGPLFSFAGIALIETITLVFFWHVLLAFIIPLFLSETYLTKSKEIAGLLPKFLQNKGKLLFTLLIIWGGLFTSVNSPNIIYSLQSTFIGTAFLLFLMFIWKKTNGTKYSIRDLMPSKKAFKWIILLIILLYLVLISSPEFGIFPGFAPQLTVWLMYAGLIFLFIKLLKKSKKLKIQDNKIKPFKWKTAIGFALLFIIFSILGELFLPLMGLFLFTYAFQIPIGIILLYKSIRTAFS